MKISRRGLIVALAGIISLILLEKIWAVTDTLERIKVRLWPKSGLPPDDEREIAELPIEGGNVSVETALNSRCTSDYDGHHKVFHWGMFDEEKKLDAEQVRMIPDIAQIPRFTQYLLKAEPNGNTITIMSEKISKFPDRDWLAIESGMLQQAICLTCAALGIGMVFKAYGSKKPQASNNMMADIRLKLDAMKPSYDDAYWTDSPPKGRKPWVKGNLVNPSRNSSQPLFGIIPKLSIHHDGTTKFDDHHKSQLLWAARGRTPHYYKSKPWGLTIPTNRGVQDNTSIMLYAGGNVFIYINWHNDRPTHVIESQGVSSAVSDKIGAMIEPAGTCIILKRNNREAYSLWEIGYQLLNILLQSSALDITYRATLLDAETKQVLNDSGFVDAAAVISF